MQDYDQKAFQNEMRAARGLDEGAAMVSGWNGLLPERGRGNEIQVQPLTYKPVIPVAPLGGNPAALMFQIFWINEAKTLDSRSNALRE